MANGKIGRNDPCPCGSGRKFKKCCLSARKEPREEVQPAHPTRNGKSNAAVAADMKERAPSGFFNLSPYVVAKIAEDPRSAGGNIALRKAIEEGLRRRWTIGKIASMTTEAIEDQLIAYGVRHSRERFLSLAEDRLSAWSISDTWIAEDGIQCSGRTGGSEDFLGLAACELWKRLGPDRPSIEIIDDWMQEGYTLVEQKKWEEACDRWWGVWIAIRDRLLTPTLTTMHAVDAVFCGSQSIFNWSQDFEVELSNAALRDARFAILGRQYCAEWAEQFTDEDERTQSNFGHALARFLFRLGESAEAERVMLALLGQYPDDPWCYVYLADAYSHLFRGEHLPLDVDKARALLKRALLLPNLEPRDHSVLKERLEELEKPRGRTL